MFKKKKLQTNNLNYYYVNLGSGKMLKHQKLSTII